MPSCLFDHASEDGVLRLVTEALSLRKAHLPLTISQKRELILTLDECSSHRNTSEVKGALV